MMRGLVRAAAGLTLAATVSLVGIALEPAAWGEACGAGGSCPAVGLVAAFTNDDGRVDDARRDPADTGIDPGWEKAVADCRARVASATRVDVRLTNAYPGYTCQLWVRVHNSGCGDLRCQPAQLEAPPGLTIWQVGAPACTKLRPGEKAWASFVVRVEQAAPQNGVLDFRIRLPFTQK